jgi:hypothetical protein
MPEDSHLHTQCCEHLKSHMNVKGSGQTGIQWNHWPVPFMWFSSFSQQWGYDDDDGDDLMGFDST